MNKRVLCMTVGASGIKTSTVLLMIALVKTKAISQCKLATAHVVPGRNASWANAVQDGAERVLWIDSDIYVDPNKLMKFMDDADAAFEADQKLAWRGALCVRRGGETLAVYEPMGGPDDGQVLLGLGVGYWHVGRMIEAMMSQKRNHVTPFQWVPPWGEDFDMGRLVWASGFKCDYDATVPTNHDGIGEWEGLPDGEPFVGAYVPKDDDDRRSGITIVPTADLAKSYNAPVPPPAPESLPIEHTRDDAGICDCGQLAANCPHEKLEDNGPGEWQE